MKIDVFNVNCQSSAKVGNGGIIPVKRFLIITKKAMYNSFSYNPMFVVQKNGPCYK